MYWIICVIKPINPSKGVSIDRLSLHLAENDICIYESRVSDDT